MNIKARCSKHPEAPVYLLEGTTTYQTEDDKPTTEQSERATQITLDEHNLYCTADDPHNHDLYFVAVP